MSDDIQRRGLMLVLSSPSGAGKSTLSRLLLEEESDISMSVSVTTRAPRTNEVEGRDYFFVTDQQFDHMVKAGDLLEYATVFGNRYGTPKKAVIDALISGRDILFDIDWQGAGQLRQLSGDLASIFILPPNHEELERRLRNRAQDSEEVVAARMAQASDEISHWAEYDYVIINDEISAALEKIKVILGAERLKLSRQTGIASFVRELMGEGAL